MAKPEKRLFTPEELREAYDLAGYLWSPESRAKVVERFGALKADAMHDRIEEMRAAFFTFRPKHKIGSTVMHDAKTVSKSFRAAYPDAPIKMIENLKVTYMTNNR